MALLKFLKGNYSALEAKAIVEGQVLICGDTGEMFVDVAADKRVKIGDFTVVSDLTTLEALDATKVPTSRLYYVEDGNILARSNGTAWVQVNKQPTIEELKTKLGLGDLAYKSEVAEDDLSAALKEKVNAAAEGNHAHDNKAELDKIADGDVEKWNNKVDKVDGKGLSTNDLTDELKGQYDAAYTHSQVAHAPADAQANIIESVKVNGTALEISDKAVDITVPTGTLAGKDKVAEGDLEEALATKINGKLDASEVTGDLLTHNASEFAVADHRHDDLYDAKGSAATVQGNLDNYKAYNDPIVASKANSADVYTKTDVDAIVNNIGSAGGGLKPFAVGDSVTTYHFDISKEAQLNTYLSDLFAANPDEDQITLIEAEPIPNTTTKLLSAVNFQENDDGMGPYALVIVDNHESEEFIWVYCTDAFEGMGLVKGFQNLTDGKYVARNQYTVTELNESVFAPINGAIVGSDYTEGGQLSNYYTKSEVNTLVANTTDAINAVSGRVAVIEGEGEGSVKKALVDAKAYTDEQIGAIPAQTDYSVTMTASDVEGLAKRYTFTQCGAEIGTIDLAKELVVTSGSVKEVETVDVPYTGAKVGDKYIELVIANQDAPIYVPAKDLVDIYTAKADATQVQVAISNTNEISATLVNGGVQKAHLEEAVQTSLGYADAYNAEKGSYAKTSDLGDLAGKNEETLGLKRLARKDTIATTEIDDNAVTTAKIVDNAVTSAKVDASIRASLAKADTALQAHQDISHLATEADLTLAENRITELEKVDHDHANKELLDTYTQTEANLADAVAKKHEHSNKAELDLVKSGDVAKWDKAVTDLATQTGRIDDLENHKDAIKERLDVLEAIDHDAYVAADTALHTTISAEIDADVKALADGQVATNAADIATLLAQLTWSEF